MWAKSSRYEFFSFHEIESDKKLHYHKFLSSLFEISRTILAQLFQPPTMLFLQVFINLKLICFRGIAAGKKIFSFFNILSTIRNYKIGPLLYWIRSLTGKSMKSLHQWKLQKYIYARKNISQWRILASELFYTNRILGFMEIKFFFAFKKIINAFYAFIYFSKFHFHSKSFPLYDMNLISKIATLIDILLSAEGRIWLQSFITFKIPLYILIFKQHNNDAFYSSNWENIFVLHLIWTTFFMQLCINTGNIISIHFLYNCCRQNFNVKWGVSGDSTTISFEVAFLCRALRS